MRRHHYPFDIERRIAGPHQAGPTRKQHPHSQTKRSLVRLGCTEPVGISEVAHTDAASLFYLAQRSLQIRPKFGGLRGIEEYRVSSGVHPMEIVSVRTERQESRTQHLPDLRPGGHLH